jgi:hypothetical protein
MELPEGNNVYGHLACDGRLPQLAQLLRVFLGVDEHEVSVKTSQFDGAQTLRVRTETAEFDAYLAGTDRKFLFNGAVAGNTEQVYTFVRALHRALQDGGFQPRLEVYDDDCKCIAEFDA